MKLMKNIGLLFLLCLAMPLIVSCVDLDENPPSDLSPQNFYTSESEYNAALTVLSKPFTPTGRDLIMDMTSSWRPGQRIFVPTQTCLKISTGWFPMTVNLSFTISG